ncbi:hypothetical protein FWJ25_02185 [Marinobacter salinexigens]|uniref:Uncharacterized protein n=1 Tax=Marinobacter salinexigens TaxID=2919747 RepID=A0A5B0VPN0_9GAMM|nr:hypothetical protein [Marinobacter salinexigens]KAA1175961.1 hypothetical protein FWJ25_02185 [Marinobacter salinexigens]
MTCDKPEQIRDDIWNQHLRWLDLISDECRSNQQKDRSRQRQQTADTRQGPESSAKPPVTSSR